MDNWILKSAYNLSNDGSGAGGITPTQVKVKVSHLLLTNYDAMIFSGAVDVVYPITIGRTAVGIVTEVGADCYGLEKGTRVLLEPTRPCGKCFECLSGKPKRCQSFKIAGKDFDGFLRDFVVCEYTDVAPLPDSVDDIHALCIESIGIAENIYDKFNLSAGQRVAVIGADFYGNIIAQVLQYHKLIPIVIDNNTANLESAQKCGIFYTFAADDDLSENIKSVTSGAMCDAAVYCSSSRLPISLATRIVSEGKNIVICAPSSFNPTIEARDVLDKRLTVSGVPGAFDYTDTAINMLIHNAVNISFFEKEIKTEYDPVALLKERCESSAAARRNKMTILKMIL